MAGHLIYRMADALLDWIRSLGQVSGDARRALWKVANLHQWGPDDFVDFFIDAPRARMPPALDLLTPYELAAIRRAWHTEVERVNFKDRRQDPSWEMLAGEPPPPLPPPGRPPSSQLVSAWPRFESGAWDAEQDRAFPHFASLEPCGYRANPGALFSKIHLPGAPRRRLQRPSSAPPGGGRASKPRKLQRKPFKQPITGPRCSGMSPWWQGSAWEQIPPLDIEPMHHDVVAQFRRNPPARVSCPAHYFAFGPRQEDYFSIDSWYRMRRPRSMLEVGHW